MIVRVTFYEKPENVKAGHSKTFTMLFGDSYKSWETQFEEFSYWYYTPRGEGWKVKNIEGKIINAEKSNSKWIGWGGLKWCPEDEFQQELNREGVQDGEPDNPKPRQYRKMKFTPMSIDILYKVLYS